MEETSLTYGDAGDDNAKNTGTKYGHRRSETADPGNPNLGLEDSKQKKKKKKKKTKKKKKPYWATVG